MDVMSWLWLGAAVLFGIVEALTAGLVSIWFVAGAAAALIGALLGAGTGVQVALFLAVSAAALAATRPLVRRFTKDGTVATNADRALGETAKVTEAIDNAASHGAALALTGHTHGCQFGIFGRAALPFFKYNRGIVHVGSTLGYVHSGNGSWFPYRIGCPPEIAYFTLRRA